MSVAAAIMGGVTSDGVSRAGGPTEAIGPAPEPGASRQRTIGCQLAAGGPIEREGAWRKSDTMS